MEYPSLSLNQDLIDRLFSGLKYGAKDESGKNVSPTSTMTNNHLRSGMKKYDIDIVKDRKKAMKYERIQKENRLKKPTLKECDQCDFKTLKSWPMFYHKKQKHTDLKQKCTDCDYSNYLPSKIKKHYKQVHLGIKRVQSRFHLKCRRELCEFVGTSNCLELQSHSRFICEKCQLSFKRNDTLKFHNEKVHLGLIFKCESCDSYSTGRKSSLARHIRFKHSGEKEQRKPRPCKEEGCSFVGTTGKILRRHIETKHEGVVRFRCHVMNCNFGSSSSKDLNRHSKTHGGEPCEEEGCQAIVTNKKKHAKTHQNESVSCNHCGAKLKNMEILKKHIGYTHEEQTKFDCPTEGCNVKKNKKGDINTHAKRCKYVKPTDGTNSESNCSNNAISSHVDNDKSKLECEKSLRSLCNIPGCDFVSYGFNKSERQDHFNTAHNGTEVAEDLFTILNHGMAEAMEILQETRDIKAQAG